MAHGSTKEISPDHPRSRGVYSFMNGDVVMCSGSSPLARGLRKNRLPVLIEFRIIPARAGFTPPIARDSTSRPDHPRSRGVYVHTPLEVSRWAGSSPLARGLLEAPLGVQISVGIIPARAGFTIRHTDRWSVPRDHPRSRGVYGTFIDNFVRLVGSSPLARGLRRRPFRISKRIRIIPARAGFTDIRYRTDGRSADHPRSRGVYTPMIT